MRRLQFSGIRLHLSLSLSLPVCVCVSLPLSAQSVSQSIGQLVSQSVGQSVGQSVSHRETRRQASVVPGPSSPADCRQPPVVPRRQLFGRFHPATEVPSSTLPIISLGQTGGLRIARMRVLAIAQQPEG